QRHAFDLQYAKQKYDSVCVLMRYRNYTQAKTKCLDLINTYPDSIQSIFAISKLFLATVAGDTSYNAANTLKIFYENLILNHPSNTSLIKRANYYILKCKVRMREYSQALAGFQQIINQNPYSYEGLIARWDYMAASLLVQGQGGGYSSIDNEQLIMNNYDIDGNDDDKKPFTKEQRQDIRKSINTAIEISKNDDEVKIKKLEEKSELGDVIASKELTQMKSLKQVVKTEKPKSIFEHVRIVSEDIRKVFGSNTSSKGNEPKNLPTVFRISQNYPNPFNPVTKINYDLPRDSKVNILIYDILGREVKRLVNNELKTAGSYIVDFNASNYSSGVYFYRIEAEETNGNKFVDSKKMVLLK
ncbi:MAG TPA: T9SS type A sorting domain-containing protein, partial [Ignavibacteria bacterium]|nr:T9SS type A sorting domain-containing protein [Ignavibacteria bacterium]